MMISVYDIGNIELLRTKCAFAKIAVLCLVLVAVRRCVARKTIVFKTVYADVRRNLLISEMRAYCVDKTLFPSFVCIQHHYAIQEAIISQAKWSLKNRSNALEYSRHFSSSTLDIGIA